MTRYMDKKSPKTTNKKLFLYISKKIHFFYIYTELIALETLSKNPYTSTFFKCIYKKSKPKSFTPILLFQLIWYIRNILELIYHFYVYIKFKKVAVKNFNTDFLIDTWILPNDVKSINYHDRYFPLLNIEIKKRKQGSIYLLRVVYNRDFSTLYQTLKQLRNQNFPFVCEFDILDIKDYWSILKMIFSLPLKLKKTIQQCKKYSQTHPYDSYFYQALLMELKSIKIQQFIRYIIGLKIAQSTPCKCILSWFENQTYEKMFFKGLSVNPKIITKGLQTLLVQPEYVSTRWDRREEKFHTLPKLFFLSSQYMLSFYNHRSIYPFLAPSFRAQKVFTTKYHHLSQDKLLVLFSYIHEDNLAILHLLKDIHNIPIIIRFHPTNNIENYTHLIKNEWAVSKEKDLYSDFQKAKLVLSQNSGSLIEGICIGVPTAIINTKKTSSSNYILPKYGKGILWQLISTKDDLVDFYKKLDKIPNKSSLTASEKNRDWFFTSLTSKTMKEVLKCQ